MHDPNQVLDEHNQRMLGRMTTAGTVGGVVGATAGLAHGLGTARKLGIAGSVAGMGLGYMAAGKEQDMAREQLGKTAAAFLQGQEYARAILALPEAEKQAILKTIDTSLGHAVSAVGQMAGRAMQGVGHAGKAIEEASREHLDHEMAGRVAGGALLIGGTAMAMHAVQQQRQQDVMAMQGFGGSPWS